MNYTYLYADVGYPFVQNHGGDGGDDHSRVGATADPLMEGIEILATKVASKDRGSGMARQLKQTAAGAVASGLGSSHGSVSQFLYTLSPTRFLEIPPRAPGSSPPDLSNAKLRHSQDDVSRRIDEVPVDNETPISEFVWGEAVLVNSFELFHDSALARLAASYVIRWRS